MRTTIELPDALRARLLELAARRGEKGFSGLVSEAVARYLDEIDAGGARAASALGVLGTLSDEDVSALEESTRRLRERWR